MVLYYDDLFYSYEIIIVPRARDLWLLALLSTFLNQNLQGTAKHPLFLVAFTRLFSSLCWSVGQTVGRSVCLSVRNHFAFSMFYEFLVGYEHC